MRAEKMKNLPGWEIKKNGQNRLCRDYIFADFRGVMVFMNAVAEIIEELDHHPEWTNNYKKLSVRLMTHSVGDVTDKDIELAQYMDRLFEEMIENG